MGRKNKNQEELCKHLDIHTIEKVNGENVLITLPYMLGEPGGEWAGHLLFTKEFLIDVVASACHREVITWQYFKQCVEKILESLKNFDSLENEKDAKEKGIPDKCCFCGEKEGSKSYRILNDGKNQRKICPLCENAKEASVSNDGTVSYNF